MEDWHWGVVIPLPPLQVPMSRCIFLKFQRAVQNFQTILQGRLGELLCCKPTVKSSTTFVFLLLFSPTSYPLSHPWAEFKVLAHLWSFWSLQGRLHFLPLPASGGCQHSLACGHIAQYLHPQSHGLLYSLSNLPQPLFYKDTCHCI